MLQVHEALRVGSIDWRATLKEIRLEKEEIINLDETKRELINRRIKVLAQCKKALRGEEVQIGKVLEHLNSEQEKLDDIITEGGNQSLEALEGAETQQADQEEEEDEEELLRRSILGKRTYCWDYVFNMAEENSPESPRYKYEFLEGGDVKFTYCWHLKCEQEKPKKNGNR